MFTRLIMLGAYLFLLAVLLPHTAWMFSLFESEQAQNLGWAAAFAFEITIAALTHFLAKELAAVSNVSGEGFMERTRRELFNIPAFLLLCAIVISVVANWTHAYYFANETIYNGFIIVQVLYSILFGAALPLCSFAYAYVLSRVYRNDTPAETDNESIVWQAILKHRKANTGRELTPRWLARQAGVTEEVASRVLAEAIESGIITMNNGKV